MPCVYGFVWFWGGQWKWTLFFFLIFLIPRALAVTIHFCAFGVQGIDWLGLLLHQTKAASQSRALCLSPAANCWSSNQQQREMQAEEVSACQERSFQGKAGGAGELEVESQIGALLRPVAASLPRAWLNIPSFQVHFSLNIWLLQPNGCLWGVGKGETRGKGTEMWALHHLHHLKWWL